MDGLHGFNSTPDCVDSGFDLPPPVIANAERRLHVRAYEHWVALLAGRPFPAISDLRLERLTDFEARSVLLDYRAGPRDPRIVRIGRALREECGVDIIAAVSDVPRGSILSRLTDHWLEVVGTRAPLGFEAEFTNHQSLPTLYRGILLPFSSDGRIIDHALGVINWKHQAPAALAEQLSAEISRAQGPR